MDKEKTTTTEVRCQRERWNDGIEVAVFQRLDFGAMVAQPLIMRELKQGELVGDPTMRLTSKEAQMLVDELWHCGIRPSEGAGSAGSLAATEKHLADMQKIALGLLKSHGV